MRRRLLYASIFCIVLYLPARAQQPRLEESYNFADMEWGLPSAEVRQILDSKGFKVSADTDGDLKFEGALLSTEVVGWALLARDKLAAVTVNFITRDQDARRTYADMRDVLAKKYGTPSNNFKFFRKPYYDGDGYEDQAIKLGKATFACYWVGSEKGKEGDLAINITEQLTVEIRYEAPFWAQEAARRKEKGTRIF